jgi:signal transduction histidine kinase
MDARIPRGKTVAREYLRAFLEPDTYNLVGNTTALMGFLWGLPVPILFCAFDMWLSRYDSVVRCLAEHPIHYFFLIHPVLFSFVFGAFGTVRRHKDAQILRLVDGLEANVAELGAANERLRELDQLKAQFVANVTHDLKTPLVAIRGYNETILEGRFGPVTDKQRGGLEVSVRNIDRLQRMIEALLDFERIEAGALRLQMSEFDLGPLIESSLEAVRPQLEDKGLLLQGRRADGVFVRADRDRIGRVLQNLLSNAVKYTPPGAAVGVEVETDPARGRARVTVWDRGVGIPASAQKFLFTRFWRAEGASRRRHGGTGLGLSIVKGILDAHQIPIEIESAEGSGTKVSFELPVAQAAELPVGQPAKGGKP